MTVRDLKATWENLGRTDPLWAVLSEPDRRHGAWDLDEFMATGRNAVGHVLELLRSHGLSLGDRVLDFGCGVGRLSNALAEHVGEVVGVDIAASMVQRAAALNSFPDRLSFVAYDGRELPFPDNSFDSAVTLIVLQHARPREQVGALMQLQRVVRPGGLLVVQVPSRARTVESLAESGRVADIVWLDAPTSFTSDAGAVVRALVTNRSDLTWPEGHQIKLGNHWYRGTELVAQDDGRTDLPRDVLPGASVELELLVTAPRTPGEYRLDLDMVQEFVAWWSDFGTQPVSRTVTVTGADGPVAEPGVPREAPVAEAPVAEETAAAGAVETEAAGGAIEMHGMHTDLVRALFAHLGHEVVAAVADTWSGPEWESFTYLVRIGS
jgi:SAM-dependent methyltransferase